MEYAKPELGYVGSTASVVLGPPVGPGDNLKAADEQGEEGVVCDLDD